MLKILYKDENDNIQVVVSYTYDPYGKPLTTTGSLASTLGADNPLRYRGYVFDSETGMYYLQSRYYDPATCRFINADSYASTGQGILGHNMFAYCLNSPVNLQDSSGACPNSGTIGRSIRNIFFCPCGGGGSYSGGGGGEAIVQGVLTVGAAVGYLFTTVIPTAISWYDDLIKQAERALSEAKAFAKTITSGEKYVVHHIVAKAASDAAPAREVLESVGIDPLTNGLNLAIIPERVHQGLHTKSYYAYVNSAFFELDNNKDAIISTLVRLQIEILIYCETGIKAW